MGFFVFGVNHKECPVAIREKLHLAPSAAEKALGELPQKNEISEIMILSTCNRVEFYAYAEKPQLAREQILEYLEHACCVPRDQFLCYLYRHEDADAVRHLFRVASGLDSMVIGENEVLGQLREAFRMANQCQSVHSLLYRLIEKGLKIGKDVRTKTKINEGAVSIPSVAVELAEKIFGNLANDKVMVLGTGEMSALTIQNLRNAGVEVNFVVSRNRERGEKVAVEYGAQWIPLDQWEQYVREMDIVIASTAAPHVIVHFEQIQSVMKKRHHKPLFLIDISVPRNIDSRINEIDDVYLYNIDDLKGVSDSNLSLRRREIEAAEYMIDEAVVIFQSWLEQMKARPMLEQYEKFIQTVLDTEINQFAKEAGIPEEKKNRVKDRLKAKLLHPPYEKIKEASKNGGVARYLTALQGLFGLDDEKNAQSPAGKDS